MDQNIKIGIKINGLQNCTDIELAGETSESRLAIDTGQDMDGELLGLFNNDVFTLRVPSNHMVVLRPLEKTVQGRRHRD